MSLEITCSRRFADWLAAQRLSLGVTTYQSAKLFLIGLQPDKRLSIFERTFSRCMGLWSNGQTMWMSAQYQMWRFENTLSPGQQANGYDRLYLPQVGYTTGDLDIHDVAVDGAGEVIFVNTLFSCLATLSPTHSFVPVWQPPFISKLAAEDRCHLNGLAVVDGRPRYVTAVSRSDVADGWRDRRADGGCLLDVESSEVVASGLSMPHSPRVYCGQLWILNSGTGELGTVDRDSGAFTPFAFCPGYNRGLAFCGDYAVVGMSRQRENRTFSGLPLDERLRGRDAESRCGLAVIDMNSGDLVHWLRFEGIIHELYDVVVLPDVCRPMAIGFKTDEIERMISVG